MDINKITQEELQKTIEDIFFERKPKDRKIIAWCVDEADGVFKNMEETLQFSRAMKEEVNKRYGTDEKKSITKK